MTINQVLLQENSSIRYQQHRNSTQQYKDAIQHCENTAGLFVAALWLQWLSNRQATVVLADY